MKSRSEQIKEKVDEYQKLIDICDMFWDKYLEYNDGTYDEKAYRQAYYTVMKKAKRVESTIIDLKVQSLLQEYDVK